MLGNRSDDLDNSLLKVAILWGADLHDVSQPFRLFHNDGCLNVLGRRGTGRTTTVQNCAVRANDGN